MTIDWLPGVLRLPATEDGGPQDLSYPPRLVLHTTENVVGSATVQGLAAFYHGSTYWPHFTADLARRTLAQHIPLSRGGRALSHTDATQTNDAHCIQVEIIGQAATSPTWTADQVDWLGHALKPVMDALTIPRLAPKFVAGGAGLNAPQRFKEATWRAFSGVCGHQHVPENDHYDPGAMDIDRFLAATKGAHVAVPPRYDPPFDINNVVDWISKAPGDTTGAFVLNDQGALFCFGVPTTRGCNGLPVIQGKHASRLDFPSPAEEAAHPGANVVIVLDDGTRSVRAPN